MRSTQTHAPFVPTIGTLLLLFLCALGFSACDSDDTTGTLDGEKTTEENNSIDGDPVSCDTLPYATVDEQLEAGMDLAQGRVEQIEPVLDAFIDPQSEGRAVDRTCDGDITPAVQVQLRVEDASWADADDHLLTITIEPDALHKSAFQPSVTDEGQLTWKKDPEFLRLGEHIAVGGALIDADTILTKLTGIYPLKDGEIIEDFDAENHCIEDDFIGRNIDDLIERVRAVEDEKPTPDMTNALHLFSSYCAHD